MEINQQRQPPVYTARLIKPQRLRQLPHTDIFRQRLTRVPRIAHSHQSGIVAGNGFLHGKSLCLLQPVGQRLQKTVSLTAHDTVGGATDSSGCSKSHSNQYFFETHNYSLKKSGIGPPCASLLSPIADASTAFGCPSAGAGM